MSNRVAHLTERSSNGNGSNNCYNYAKNFRILAVDDNSVCLKLLSVVLKNCGYQFTAMSGAREAYEVLKKNRDSYDIVLCNVKNNMGEFKLLDLIKLEMDIPVILLSADDSKDSVLEGMRRGAQDYLVKPVRSEDIKIIWQHLARKDHYRSKKICHQIAEKSPNPEPSLKRQNSKISENKREIKGQVDGENKKAPLKRPRLQWTKEMKMKFERAIEELGIENATPTKIRELMNEPTVTRSNIASHLQKHRINLHNAKETAEKNTQACVNAMRSLYHSSTLACSKDQCIECHSFQNMSVQWGVTDTNLSSFAANIHANSSTMNPQDTLPENNQQISRMGNQMSSMFVNNCTMGWSAHPNQHFRTQQEEDGTRIVSFYPRPKKMENNYNGPYLCFSSGYNPSGGQFQVAQSSNSLPMLPPRHSYGPVQIPGSIQLTQMAQPSNSRAMLPPSSSYGRMHMLDSTQSTQMVHEPTNYQPMIPPISSYGPIKMPGSTQPPQMAPSTNSEAMLPPSSSYGPIHLLGSTQSTQMAQPTNFLGSTQSTQMAQMTNYQPMISSSSSYGPIRMPGSTQPTQMAQPTNSLPILPPSSSYGPSEIQGSTHSTQTIQATNSMPPSSSNGQLEKRNSIDTQQQSVESSISDVDQILNSEFEFDLAFNFLDNDLLSMVSQFDDEIT